MLDSSFTPDILHRIWHDEATLPNIKWLVDILETFAYHEEPLTTQDMQNMFILIAKVNCHIDTLIETTNIITTTKE